MQDWQWVAGSVLGLVKKFLVKVIKWLKKIFFYIQKVKVKTRCAQVYWYSNPDWIMAQSG